MARRVPLTATLVALALLLAACASTQDAPAGGSQAAGSDDCTSVNLDQPPDRPVTIRIGHGVAAEEPFWLMTAKPDLTQYQGAGGWYELALSPFRGTEERLQTYQAGELDAVVISPQAQIKGAATGALDLYAIVTVMREAEPGAFSTSFVARQGAGITSPKDLAGKRIAVVDIGSQLDWLARAAVQQGGADPEDTEYVVFPFPAQAEALRANRIDVAGLPEPFYTQAKLGGGIVDVFNAADLTDFAYDLLTISFKRQFVEDNLAAVCAFRDDYAAAMDWYQQHTDQARELLAGTEFVSIPPQVYLKTGDYARPEGGTVDTQGMTKMMDHMIDLGILTQDERVDVATLVRPGVSAGQEQER